MKERELQENIRDTINRTELFWAVIADVKPVWFKGKWISNQATPGLSDLIVFCRKDQRVILIEVKKPGEKLSPNQKKFQELCRLNNVAYDIVTNSLEALRILHFWCRKWGIQDVQLEAILKQL